MLAALLLAAATAQPDPLRSALSAAHRDYMTQLTDKFAEATADPSLVGKPFKFMHSMHDGDSYSGDMGSGYYTYHDGKLRLVFIPDEKYAGAGIEGPKYMVGLIGSTRTHIRNYVGSNAFGVTRTVEVVRLDEDGLAMLDRPEGEESPYTSSGPILPSIAARLPALPKKNYWVEMTLPGPEARKVAMDAALLIEGTIRALDGGKLSYCKANYIEAQIDAPTEIYGSECWVGANVSRIAFIRRSTGEVLKQWVK